MGVAMVAAREFVLVVPATRILPILLLRPRRARERAAARDVNSGAMIATTIAAIVMKNAANVIQFTFLHTQADPVDPAARPVQRDQSVVNSGTTIEVVTRKFATATTTAVTQAPLRRHRRLARKARAVAAARQARAVRDQALLVLPVHRAHPSILLRASVPKSAKTFPFPVLRQVAVKAVKDRRAAALAVNTKKSVKTCVQDTAQAIQRDQDHLITLMNPNAVGTLKSASMYQNPALRHPAEVKAAKDQRAAAAVARKVKDTRNVTTSALNTALDRLLILHLAHRVHLDRRVAKVAVARVPKDQVHQARQVLPVHHGQVLATPIILQATTILDMETSATLQ